MSKDGGPAFPFDWKDFQPHTGEQVVREQYPGMTLRDWFAGQAIDHALKSFSTSNIEDGIRLRAEYVYKIADAMLAERERVTEKGRGE